MRLCLSAILLPILATAAREERYLVVPTTDVSAGNNATTMAPAEEEPLTNAPIPTAEKTTKDLPAGDLDVGDSSIFPVFLQPGGLDPPLRPNFSPIYTEERTKPKRRTNAKTLNRHSRDVKDTKEVKKEAKKEAAGRPQDLDKSESRLEFQTSYPEVPPRPRKQQPPPQQQQQQQKPKRRPQPEDSFQAVVQRPPETVSSTPKGCTA